MNSSREKDTYHWQGNMISMPRTEHHCRTHHNKAYTNFTWSLEDWTLLRGHYDTVVSPEFVVHGTDGKTCRLKFKTLVQFSSYRADIHFPIGIQYHTMKTTLSIIDNKSVKRHTIDKVVRNSDRNLTIYLEVPYGSFVNNCLVNDTLTLFLELTIVTPIKDSTLRTEILDTDFSTDICKNFKVILDSKDLYDVTFVVRGKKLYAHKVILAANSEVFRAMFTAHMKEQKKNTVEIVDTDADVFEEFLRYMYTGRVSEIRNMIDELIVVADKYQVMNLKKLCERYMLNHINH